ncbi:TRAP transporter large permease [Falsigemmobacter intermedius]|uniref:TRAP transporter large permease protein n=1 Tax=Falsigemmobacter intermedius TaxID=1553448 RepID=A0A3S3VSU1_9RHOB|nr:TRAP transporter large permease [Falsigemmobacter intermedius]RWY41612.1 TRAP transporter large permease [Falsigemmobacter intermedius]
MFDPATAAIITIGLLFFLMIAGVHIGVAMGLCGVLGIYLTMGEFAALAQAGSVPFATVNSFTLAVIPLFILMGSLATQARLTTDLYAAAYNWFSKMPGGLAMTTTIASAAFGAASGSTMVNAAVFTKMAMPEMTTAGYDKRLSSGAIASAGVLSAMIPPSVLMVIYAITTEQSVGKMLIAGIVPGIMTAVLFLLCIYVWAKLKPEHAPMPEHNVTMKEKIGSLKNTWGILLLFGVVIGGIYGGWFIPTYAGAVGAFGAFLLVFYKRRASLKTLRETFLEAIMSSATIFLVVFGGMLFARFLTYTGLVATVSDWLILQDLAPFAYLLAFGILFLILGCFIEPIAIMVMTLPVMFPVMMNVGYDPIWLGVVVIKMCEISLITPPVGLNVFVVRSSSPVPLRLEQVFAGVTPFIAMEVLSLGLLIMFPAIVTWLPSMIG